MPDDAGLTLFLKLWRARLTVFPASVNFDHSRAFLGQLLYTQNRHMCHEGLVSQKVVSFPSHLQKPKTCLNDKIKTNLVSNCRP